MTGFIKYQPEIKEVFIIVYDIAEVFHQLRKNGTKDCRFLKMFRKVYRNNLTYQICNSMTISYQIWVKVQLF